MKSISSCHSYFLNIQNKKQYINVMVRSLAFLNFHNDFLQGERVMSKLLFFFVAHLPELAADPNKKIIKNVLLC